MYAFNVYYDIIRKNAHWILYPYAIEIEMCIVIYNNISFLFLSERLRILFTGKVTVNKLCNMRTLSVSLNIKVTTKQQK